jgi:transcriptional regulator with XRE-family HTH domain
MRVGKRVTQEELAEHLEISRGWYARFEAGAPAAFSMRLLSRLGDMLLLTAQDRAELMRLAMPELAPVVRRDRTNLYEALGVVRRAVKRLWSATSEVEILHIAGEEARQLLPCFELIFSRPVVAVGEAQFLRDGGNSTARYAEARSYSLRRLTREQLGGLEVLWQRTPAGAVLSCHVYPRETLRRYCLGLREHGFDWDSPVAAHIRGSSGSALLGCASRRPHDVAELERAMLSTIAEFASLALQ